MFARVSMLCMVPRHGARRPGARLAWALAPQSVLGLFGLLGLPVLCGSAAGAVGGLGMSSSRSSSPPPARRAFGRAGTRLHLLRHTERIDFADHSWVRQRTHRAGPHLGACARPRLGRPALLLHCSGLTCCPTPPPPRLTPPLWPLQQAGKTDSPYDPYLTETGHKQAGRIGFQLMKAGISRVSACSRRAHAAAWCLPTCRRVFCIRPAGRPDACCWPDVPARPPPDFCSRRSYARPSCAPRRRRKASPTILTTCTRPRGGGRGGERRGGGGG